MATHGGKRSGAGKKRGTKAAHTIQAETTREYFVTRVTEELEPIATAQIEAAKGIYVEEIDQETGDRIRVYRRAPDIKAGEYLLNQVVGKAKETVEVHSPVRLRIDF